MQEIIVLQDQALAEVKNAASTAELKDLKIKFLGNNGLISGKLREIGSYQGDKKAFGQAVNAAKQAVEVALTEREEELRVGELVAQFENERIDVTMPARAMRVGYEHILQQTTNKIKRVLGSLGFEYLESPELEHVKYNFDALNYPPDHPAMDDQDTFYIDDEYLLRTQCTDLQGRVFEEVRDGKRTLPLRVFTVGRTFRNEAVDRTHSHTFHQVDCFMVDEKVSMANLKGTLGIFARQMFGKDVTVRFRPDFFPFVEPGVDYAISTPKLFNGRWVELGGAGLIHPNILENYGIDTEKYSGFAFGLGVERIPMMSYGVDDLRHFLENDLRFLEQFKAEPVEL
ncbi:MAG: phenylalanine--tRNA ligase subunit alpha [Armatimonadetes bacterium]|nr:phenylalanine--tRNA ligase subunit alpha [Armatimonadota bacterium]